ncbi:MAG: penicillin-binding transpeptidase domain-containing protein [Chloroflexota bacterium]
MAFAKEISRLMFGVIVVFIVIIGSASYWAIVGADSILLREDNPRLVEAEASIQRGAIYDRSDNLLVQTRPDENGVLERVYLVPETYSAIGYFSLRYGTSATEFAFDDLLRGDTTLEPLQTVIQQDLLHRPQQGSDIRLTLDLTIQQTIVESMGGYSGAVVVLSVPDGQVLGLVSLPTYNPNTLDADWDTLIEADGNPFFNRALQGQYQPGGMLQTPLMVAGILINQPFDVVTSNATRPLMIDGQQITCATQPDEQDLSYQQSYAFGCPFPFSLLADELSSESISNIIQAFRLDSPTTITGFTFDEQPITPEITPEPIAEETLADYLIGQGDLTINPLGMATIVSAIINGGNAPQPYILDASRSDDGIWQSERPITQQSIPMLTTNASRRLRELMRNNTLIGASTPAARDGLTIGGHTALAISGEGTQTWFIGYVSLGDQRGVAVALVLENTDNAFDAATIGGNILEQATITLQQPTD